MATGSTSSTLDPVQDDVEDLTEEHEALPMAPPGTPDDMLFATMTVKNKGTHTFVGPPDQVTTWLGHMQGLLGCEGYIVIFRDYGHGFWGENVSRRTRFLPGRHYRIDACFPPRQVDPNRPCRFCEPLAALGR